MATAYRGFQLGLLPERKINKRALATSYGLVALVILILINLELIMPEKLKMVTYHVTEMIPMPALAAGAGADQDGSSQDQAQAASGGEAAGV